MRLLAAAGLGFALAACGGGNEGSELAAGNSHLSEAQIDAALGPANQSMVEDAVPANVLENGAELAANEGAPAINSAAADREDQQ